MGAGTYERAGTYKKQDTYCILCWPAITESRLNSESRISEQRRRSNPKASPDAAFAAAIIRLDTLTKTERVVLKLIARNMTSQEVARELKVSPKTVENHRSKICHKLEITGNNALLRFALGCAAKIEEMS